MIDWTEKPKDEVDDGRLAFLKGDKKDGLGSSSHLPPLGRLLGRTVVFGSRQKWLELVTLLEEVTANNPLAFAPVLGWDADEATLEVQMTYQELSPGVHFLVHRPFTYLENMLQAIQAVPNRVWSVLYLGPETILFDEKTDRFLLGLLPLGDSQLAKDLRDRLQVGEPVWLPPSGCFGLSTTSSEPYRLSETDLVFLIALFMLSAIVGEQKTQQIYLKNPLWIDFERLEGLKREAQANHPAVSPALEFVWRNILFPSSDLTHTLSARRLLELLDLYSGGMCCRELDAVYANACGIPGMGRDSLGAAVSTDERHSATDPDPNPIQLDYYQPKLETGEGPDRLSHPQAESFGSFRSENDFANPLNKYVSSYQDGFGGLEDENPLFSQFGDDKKGDNIDFLQSVKQLQTTDSIANLLKVAPRERETKSVVERGDGMDLQASLGPVHEEKMGKSEYAGPRRSKTMQFDNELFRKGQSRQSKGHAVDLSFDSMDLPQDADGLSKIQGSLEDQQLLEAEAFQKVGLSSYGCSPRTDWAQSGHYNFTDPGGQSRVPNFDPDGVEAVLFKSKVEASDPNGSVHEEIDHKIEEANFDAAQGSSHSLQLLVALTRGASSPADPHTDLTQAFTKPSEKRVAVETLEEEKPTANLAHETSRPDENVIRTLTFQYEHSFQNPHDTFDALPTDILVHSRFERNLQQPAINESQELDESDSKIDSQFLFARDEEGRPSERVLGNILGEQPMVPSFSVVHQDTVDSTREPQPFLEELGQGRKNFVALGISDLSEAPSKRAPSPTSKKRFSTSPDQPNRSPPPSFPSNIFPAALDVTAPSLSESFAPSQTLTNDFATQFRETGVFTNRPTLKKEPESCRVQPTDRLVSTTIISGSLRRPLEGRLASPSPTPFARKSPAMVFVNADMTYTKSLMKIMGELKGSDSKDSRKHGN